MMLQTIRYLTLLLLVSFFFSFVGSANAGSFTPGEVCDATEYSDSTNYCCGGNKVCNSKVNYRADNEGNCTVRSRTGGDIGHSEFTLPGCGAPTPTVVPTRPPTATPPPGQDQCYRCNFGTQCAQYLVPAGTCSTNCSACQSTPCPGGHCGGGEPTATPIPGPSNTPTPVQATKVVSLDPSFTVRRNAAISQRIVCLDAKPCSKADSQCSGRAVVDVGHRVKLQSRSDVKPLPGQTHVLECLSIGRGLKCTTGTSALDKTFLGQDNAASLASSHGYQFLGFFQRDGIARANNPISTAATGDIDTHEWESKTTNTIHKLFMAVNEMRTSDNAGNQGGQQQATFSFASENKNCIQISWDPYGRIFDSHTLEPLANATVTLLKQVENGQFVKVTETDVIGGVRNPVITKEDGVFNFLVPDGSYKIAVQKASYSFSGNRTMLDSHYADFYPGIYTGDVIIQSGKPVHVNIPLDPTDEKASETFAHGNTAKIMIINQRLDKQTNQYIVEGVVSHPRATVAVYGKKPSGNSFVKTGVLATVEADMTGLFKAIIPVSKLTQNEVVGEVGVEKRSIAPVIRFKSFIDSVKNTLVRPVLAADSKVQIDDPILNYLEGYAYDANGSVIPDARVGVYLTFSDKPYATATADSSGYFVVPSDMLPPIPYVIKYEVNGGRRVTRTTSQFLLDNQKYLAKNNINTNSFVETGMVAGASNQRVFSYIPVLLFVISVFFGTKLLRKR